jgi:hypothetical protein
MAGDIDDGGKVGRKIDGWHCNCDQGTRVRFSTCLSPTPWSVFETFANGGPSKSANKRWGALRDPHAIYPSMAVVEEFGFSHAEYIPEKDTYLYIYERYT